MDCMQSIPGSSQGVLSALAWLGGDDGRPQLVSGGLDGSITQWDLTTLRPAAVTDSYGGAVWALSVQPPQADGAAWVCSCWCSYLLKACSSVSGTSRIASRRSELACPV